MSDCSSSASNQCVTDNVNYVVAVECGVGQQTAGGVGKTTDTNQTSTDHSSISETNDGMLQNQCNVVFITVMTLLSIVVFIITDNL